MNKIQRLVFTIACLLTTLGGYSYKIVKMTAVNGTISATYNSNAIITFNEGGSVTDIPDNNNVTLNITPDAGFYLQKIEYELMTDLGNAQGRTRNSIDFATKQTIQINPSYAANHYGGVYSFAMPASDIEITATFAECTDLSTAKLYWDSWDGVGEAPKSKIYNSVSHTLNVMLGTTPLAINTDYTITTPSTPTALKLTNVGTLSPKIVGAGIYKGTINDNQESPSEVLSITQRTLRVQANAGQTKVYGASDPVFTYTYDVAGAAGVAENEGLCPGDQITGTLARAAGETVTPTYSINIGTLSAGSNYNIIFTSQDFTITSKNISTDGNVTITLNESYHNYDGSSHGPTFDNTGNNSKVEYGNTTLVYGTDYTVSTTQTNGVYTNSTNYIDPDIYTIDISFMGNYSGSKQVNYQIRKEVALVGSNKWFTFCETTYNMYLPAEFGFKAYTVTGISENAVVLEERSYIKKNVPMLLNRPGDGTSFFPTLVKEEEVPGTWTNVFSSYMYNSTDRDFSTNPVTSGKEIWILVNDEFVRTKSGTLPGGKCYLELNKGQQTSVLPVRAHTSGISTPVIGDVDLNSAWYTLDGRKLQGIPTKKGIYISNGKKVIIK